MAVLLNLFFLFCLATSAPVSGPIFELDLFVNDPGAGWQSTGWPPYMQKAAANYTNVAGISFIQPSDLMNSAYDLPSQVANAVHSLRAQGVAVQLLIGGEISTGWPQLAANPTQAANKAIELMKKYDCGVEIDNEAGGSSDGLISFIKQCAAGKPENASISMDVNGTPSGAQIAVFKGASDELDWINLMVSNPSYDQENSMKFANADGIPYSKMTVAYYAGTWVTNCNTVGTTSDVGDTARGIQLVNQYKARGLSIWAVGGASYGGCSTTDAPGFSQAMVQLKAHNTNGTTDSII